MKVLVIGGAGFLGLHITQRFVLSGHEVTILTREKSSVPSLSFLSDVTIVEGNITDQHLIERLVKNKDEVVNVAGIIDNTKNPGGVFKTLDVNIIGELYVLEAIRKYNPTAHHTFIGSRTQFGVISKGDQLISEDQAQVPFTSYAITKSAAEHYIEHYRQVYSLSTCVLRSISIYGIPLGNKGGNVLNYFVKKALHGEQVTVFGDGKDFKDFIWVEDLSDLFLEVATQRIVGLFNVGSGEGFMMKDIARQLLEICQSDSELVFRELSPEERLFDFDSCIMDITYVKSKTNWSPKISLEVGIGRLREYYEGVA